MVTKNQKWLYLLRTFPPPRRGATVWAFVILPGMHVAVWALSVPLLLLALIGVTVLALGSGVEWLLESGTDWVQRKERYARFRALAGTDVDAYAAREGKAEV